MHVTCFVSGHLTCLFLFHLYSYYPMKNLFPLFSSMLVVALLTTSCSKESSEYSPTNAKTVAQNATSFESADANPYDYVGKQHNMGLDNYLQKGDVLDIPNQYEAITLDYGVELGYSRDEMEATRRDPQLHEIITSDAPPKAFRAFLELTGQKQELAYFDKIEKVLTTASTAPEAVSALRELEQAVLHDKELEPQVQTALLKGLAVGRHSAEYWYSQAQLGADSPWNGKAGESTGKKGAYAAKFDWGHWGIVALCDAIGAFGGGWFGAVCCSLMAL